MGIFAAAARNGSLRPARHKPLPGRHFSIRVAAMLLLARGCRRLLVALLPVRVLLLSAKHLILAAKQLFLAAKHAVACMSLPRRRFQRELSASNRATPSGP